MKIFELVRVSDWWEHKLPPLLLVGYATAIFEQVTLLNVFPWLLFLSLIFIVVATFVSLLNDLTDLRDDIVSRKSNRLKNFSSYQRWLLVACSLVTTFFLLLFLKNDLLSILFLLLSVVSFILYSLPPLRLKSRGFFGVIADAAGSHLFPSLFFATSVTHFLESEPNLTWLLIIAFWSFFYGLRGIIWHQFWDKDYDVAAGLTTFATTRDANRINNLTLAITFIEVISLGFLLFFVGSIIPVLALIGYTGMIAVYLKIGKEIVFIVPSTDSWHFLFSDFYQVFFPFSLIIVSSFINPFCLLLFIFHIGLFPVKMKEMVADFLIFVGSKSSSSIQ